MAITEGGILGYIFQDIVGKDKELLSKRRKVSADGAASELAGVDRYTFLDFCKQEGVTLQTQTTEDLEADLKKFATAN